jgi:hypothetical protein
MSNDTEKLPPPQTQLDDAWHELVDLLFQWSKRGMSTFDVYSLLMYQAALGARRSLCPREGHLHNSGRAYDEVEEVLLRSPDPGFAHRGWGQT